MSRSGASHLLGRHNLQRSKSKKYCSCPKNRKGGRTCHCRLGRVLVSAASIERKERSSYCQNRKGGRACLCRLGRHYKSAISVPKTRRTLTTFSVDIILKIGRVRRGVPIVRIGKVVEPVSVDLVGTTRARCRSRRRGGRSPPSRST
jgi:hypothetical protein